MLDCLQHLISVTRLAIISVERMRSACRMLIRSSAAPKPPKRQLQHVRAWKNAFGNAFLAAFDAFIVLETKNISRRAFLFRTDKEQFNS